MAQWNDGSKWSSSTLWGPSSPTASGTVQMRDQLNGLNDLISAKPSLAEVNNAVSS
jgi:hypothetical protein